MSVDLLVASAIIPMEFLLRKEKKETQKIQSPDKTYFSEKKRLNKLCCAHSFSRETFARKKRTLAILENICTPIWDTVRQRRKLFPSDSRTEELTAEFLISGAHFPTIAWNWKIDRASFRERENFLERVGTFLPDCWIIYMAMFAGFLITAQRASQESFICVGGPRADIWRLISSKSS